jgi:hypothetical protein
MNTDFHRGYRIISVFICGDLCPKRISSGTDQSPDPISGCDQNICSIHDEKKRRSLGPDFAAESAEAAEPFFCFSALSATSAVKISSLAHVGQPFAPFRKLNDTF